MEEEDELSKICEDFGPYAPGWNCERLKQRIREIRRYYKFNSDKSGGIPLSKRREIARNAKTLLESLDGMGGLDWLFLQTLKGLAEHSEDRQTLEGHVAAMIVRLYIEAHKKPGFTPRGPLVRFAKAIYDVLEVPKTERLTEATLKNEFNKLKLDAFISRCLEFVAGESITAGQLLTAWENDCAANGVKPTLERFSQRIQKHEKFKKHVECAWSEGHRFYRGVKLKAKFNKLDPASKNSSLRSIYKTMG